jgi:hypothetical protein
MDASGERPDPTDGAADGGDGAIPEDAPPQVCRPGTPWNGTDRLFQSDQSGPWGLDGVNATGLATGDLDGDGYPDLIAWDSPPNVRSNLDATPPVFHVRVLMNRPREDGVGRRFVDNTRGSNLLEVPSGGQGRVVHVVALADVDNDGDLDVYTGVKPEPPPAAGMMSTIPRDPGDRSAVLLNDGRGVFRLAPASDTTPAGDEYLATIGAVFTDQDLDGLVDLFVGYHSQPFGLAFGQQPQLFRGGGDGSFRDVTSEVGLGLEGTTSSLNEGTSRRPLYGVSACDVNGDGRQDLLGAAYGRQFNLLFVSQGATFVNASLTSGMGGDQARDYSDNLSYRCFCQGSPSACPRGVPAPPAGFCPGRGWRRGTDDQPWRLNGNTFSIACGDVDNDGDLDLYTADIAHPDVGSSSDRAELLLNESTTEGVLFRRPGRREQGLEPPGTRNNDEGGISNALWDFDHDGRMDVWLGGSDYNNQYGWAFRQTDNGRFQEVGMASGLRHPCPHGLALADFDQDGDIDVVQGTSTFRSFCASVFMGRNVVRMFENTGTQANWVSVRLVGRGAGGANRSAVGARVRLTAGGVTQTREVQGVWGVAGLSQDLTVHFGLGATCAVERLEVRWPDAMGSTETFPRVVSNRRIEVRQGEGRLRYLP